MPPIPNLQDPLSDGAVALRLTAERDIPEILIAYENDPRMHEHLGEPRPPSGAQLGQASEAADEDRLHGRYVALSIVAPPADDCLGQVRVHTIEWIHARAELGLWVSPAERGRGLGRRALRLAAGWLFGHCGLVRVGVLTDPDNEPMRHAARAAGFVEEGVLRGYFSSRRGRLDAAVLSLLSVDLVAAS